MRADVADIIAALRHRLTLRALRENQAGMQGEDISGAEAVRLVVMASRIEYIPPAERYRNYWCSHKLIVDGKRCLLAVEWDGRRSVDWAGYSGRQKRAR